MSAAYQQTSVGQEGVATAENHGGAGGLAEAPIRKIVELGSANAPPGEYPAGRQQVQMNRKVDKFFHQLTPEEQNRFLDLTLPSGMKQMMEALNKMPPEKRKQFVTKALEDMKKRGGEGAPETQRELDANGQKIIDQGLKSFYSDASAETKMDLAPLIEQFNHNLQGGMR